MGGNVRQWTGTSDVEVADHIAHHATPGGEPLETAVVCGGSWFMGPIAARCASQYFLHLALRDGDQGFRIARSTAFG
jgi:formylglycine-generating enzyme required for sulfatase activity